jgi:DNA-binding transcriptional ArsR family regulator
MPIAVPSTSETTVNTRWTAKNPVIPWCHDRESFQMFFRKTGQMTQLHTPNAMKNQAMRFEMTMAQVSRLAHRPAPCVNRPTPLTYNQMVVLQPSDDDVDRIFQALADATRRDILARARDGQSVSALARRYEMSFAAVQKHVAVLERAALVTKQRRGREQIVQGNQTTLRRAAELLSAFEQIWIQRATQIAGILADEDGDIA